MVVHMLDDLADDPADDPADDIDARMHAAIAEPGDYDQASASTLPITNAQSLALACRRMRRHANASQRAFAARAGLSKTTVARIETGAIDPSVGVLLKLVAAAGATLTLTGLDPTTFVFGVVENQRDAAGRHAPPHRLSEAGAGWWDPSFRRPVAQALVAHKADISLLVSVVAARDAARAAARDADPAKSPNGERFGDPPR